MDNIGVLVALEVSHQPRLAHVTFRVDGIIVSPVGDGCHRYTALEDVLSLIRQHAKGSITTIGPTPYGNSPRIDDVQVVDEILRHRYLIFDFYGAQLLPDFETSLIKDSRESSSGSSSSSSSSSNFGCETTILLKHNLYDK